MSSAAILFAENRYRNHFFFNGKKFYRKKFVGVFFFLKLKNQGQIFPGRTKIADFRKNADDWKHWLLYITGYKSSKQISNLMKDVSY